MFDTRRYSRYALLETCAHPLSIDLKKSDITRWNRALQKPSLFRNTHELILDTVLSIHLDNLDTNTKRRLHEGLLHMMNVRRAKFTYTRALGQLEEILDALAHSKCSLEEIDLGLCFQRSGETPPSMNAMKELPIWTKFDLSVLSKLAIQLRSDSRFPILGEITFLGHMLSNAHILTHLHLTIEHTDPVVFLNLLEYTWPNLENLTINGTISLVPTGAHLNPSDLINFFKRHSNLTTLSFSSNIFPQFSILPPYITTEHLPKLESFSYDIPINFEAFEGLQVKLDQVLSPASARRLRHLTIDERDAEHSNMDIYKELTSLQSCCITSRFIIPLVYNNVYRILDSLVGHATNLQKIFLPPHTAHYYERLEEDHFMPLPFLRGLPNLTHLSGLWLTGTLGSELTWQRLLQEFHHFDKLRFVIPAEISQRDEKRALFYKLNRDYKGARAAEAVQGTILPNDMEYLSWGGFYRGMVKEVQTKLDFITWP
ncbi:hypothetical protein Clacol_001227 [Clathrus columnatus]|uniref:Uncharacterized protein n=1 Tax=Clathrus columnatus TaxID=1419009 RepID=A0AAV5A2P9_9AGAM|nr:hypothetical protein Clacol_001227 [Clathrus columnatus]